jgi:hypothetical protein
MRKGAGTRPDGFGAGDPPGSGDCRLTGVRTPSEESEGACFNVMLSVRPRPSGVWSLRRGVAGARGLSSGDVRVDEVPGRAVVIVGGERTTTRGFAVVILGGEAVPITLRGLNGDVERDGASGGARGGPPTLEVEKLRGVIVAVADTLALGRAEAGTSGERSFLGVGGRLLDAPADGGGPLPKSKTLVVTWDDGTVNDRSWKYEIHNVNDLWALSDFRCRHRGRRR